MSAKGKGKPKGGLSIKPLGDRLVVKPSEEAADKVGSLYIPDAAKEKPLEGTIVVLGTGKKKKVGGDAVAFDVSVGDKVLYGKYSGTEIKVDGDTYLMMHEGDVLAVIE